MSLQFFPSGKHAILHVSSVVSIFDCRHDLLGGMPHRDDIPCSISDLLKSFASVAALWFVLLAVGCVVVVFVFVFHAHCATDNAYINDQADKKFKEIVKTARRKLEVPMPEQCLAEPDAKRTVKPAALWIIVRQVRRLKGQVLHDSLQHFVYLYTQIVLGAVSGSTPWRPFFFSFVLSLIFCFFI